MTWWLPSTPDMGIAAQPWLHPAAVCYLEKLLRPEMTVIEHGCGGSTLWFAERVAHVTAVDDDSDWIMAMARETKTRTNVRLYPMDGVPTLDPADLLLIDGRNHDRPAWMMKAKDFVKPGGIIVLDNAERAHYIKGREYLMTICGMPTSITAYTAYNKLVVTEFYRVPGGEIGWI